MQRASRILTSGDCDAIIANLDSCLVLFDRKKGLLSSAEIRAKSLLSVVRNEIVREKEGASVSEAPFDKPGFD